MITHSLSEITHFDCWDYTLVSVEVNRSDATNCYDECNVSIYNRPHYNSSRLYFSGMMKLSEFTAALIRVSEKAAQLARRIRSEEALFSLLVEEKTGESKNKRFVQDFKTLADVLIQETVRHDLGQQVNMNKTI